MFNILLVLPISTNVIKINSFQNACWINFAVYVISTKTKNLASCKVKTQSIVKIVNIVKHYCPIYKHLIKIQHYFIPSFEGNPRFFLSKSLCHCSASGDWLSWSNHFSKQGIHRNGTLCFCRKEYTAIIIVVLNILSLLTLFVGI